MTLSTYVYLQDPVPVDEVFEFCLELLGRPPLSPPVRTKDEVWYPKDDPDVRCRMTEPGQGLPAWLMVKYREDGPLRAEPEPSPNEYGEEVDYPEPAHWVEVNFDTSYSYSDEYGGCSTLHARLIVKLGQWLKDRGVKWSWSNEYTGEIFPGGDDKLLAELVAGGAGSYHGDEARRKFLKQLPDFQQA